MTPLVLVHGFMGGSAQWEDQLEGIGNVVTVDLPGFGQSAQDAPCDSIEAYADWVITQLRARGITRYNLLGHSMGGMIVQEMARRDAANVARLILYATGSIGVLPGRFETIAQSKARTLSDGPRATARRICATWFAQYEAAKGYEGCARIAECASAGALAAGLDAMEAWSGEDALPEISAPTLILWGDRDRTYTWDQIQTLWTRIPRTNLAVIPNCAHAVHLEQPSLFNATVRAFLAAELA